jgi:hypothetical protein
MACGSRNLYFLSGLKTSVLSHRETCRGSNPLLLKLTFFFGSSGAGVFLFGFLL